MRAVRSILLLFCIIGMYACVSATLPIPKSEIPKDLDPKIKTEIENLYSYRDQVRAQAAYNLGNMKKDAIPAVPFLIGLLNDTAEVHDVKITHKELHVTVGMIVARALGSIRDRRSIKPLIRARKGDISMIREVTVALGKIANALSGSENNPAFDALIEAMKDKNDFTRKYTAEMLGRLGDPAAIDVLIGALSDRYAPIREQAVEALDEIGDKRAVIPLTTVLKKDEPAIKASAARVLGRMGDSRAIEALIGALYDTDFSVRSSSALALKSISGVDFGEDKQGWKDWFERNKHRFR